MPWQYFCPACGKMEMELVKNCESLFQCSSCGLLYTIIFQGSSVRKGVK